MDWQQALRQRLVGDAAVAAIVDARVHWNTRPQGGALPAIVAQVIDDPRPQTMAGLQSLRASLVQLGLMAATAADVAALEAAVVAAIVPAASVSGIVFERAFIEASRGGGEQTTIEFIHRTLLDVRVWHRTA